MYLHHELREVADFRQSEALARISTLHHLMQRSPGFIRSLACRYLGNTTQYAWLRTWSSSEDHAAFRQTEPAMVFARTRPEGLYWPLAGGIAPEGHWWSVQQDGDADGGGKFLARMAASVPADSVEAFVKSRTLNDSVLRSTGIVSSATFESEAESDNRTFLTLIRTNDLEACRAFLGSEQAAEILGLQSSGGRLLVTEYYEIVEELRGD